MGATNVTEMVDAINDISGTTGVVATASGNTAIILTDADGDDITVENGTALTTAVCSLDRPGRHNVRRKGLWLPLTATTQLE